jgi:hypothetical protein
MVDVAANDNMPDHSFQPKITACAPCHKDKNGVAYPTFDFGASGSGATAILGARGKYYEGMKQLQALLNTAGLINRTGTAGTALDSTQLGVDYNLDQPISGVTVTTAQAGAVWNYLTIARGGGNGSHNPAYIRQLLWDSITAMGATPTSKFATARP